MALSVGSGLADAKDKIKVTFIGPLTGGVSANGIGGRNSAELAVRLRNSDPTAKYEYEMVTLDDECKPNVGVQAFSILDAQIAAQEVDQQFAVLDLCGLGGAVDRDLDLHVHCPPLAWASAVANARLVYSATTARL